MAKAIIFDLFGVICPDLYWVWLKKVVPDLETKKDYFQELSNQLDLGEITPEQFIKTLSEKTAVAEKSTVPQMNQALEIDQDLVRLISELGRNYKIGLLSNSNSFFTDKILREYNLTPLFSTITISEKVGFIKPRREIFDITVKNLGTTPEETIFIDDREVHAKAAEKLGFAALVFTNTNQLKEDLVKLGVVFQK